jgi:hypothetical protein
MTLARGLPSTPRAASPRGRPVPACNGPPRPTPTARPGTPRPKPPGTQRWPPQMPPRRHTSTRWRRRRRCATSWARPPTPPGRPAHPGPALELRFRAPGQAPLPDGHARGRAPGRRARPRPGARTGLPGRATRRDRRRPERHRQALPREPDPVLPDDRAAAGRRGGHGLDASRAGGGPARPRPNATRTSNCQGSSEGWREDDQRLSAAAPPCVAVLSLVITFLVSRSIAGAPVPLVDHARAERPGLDQGQPNVFGDRRQEGRAATDDDRVAEHVQLVDEAELDRGRG